MSIPQLIATANQVKAETLTGANTAARIGQLFLDIVRAVAFPIDTTLAYEPGQSIVFQGGIWECVAYANAGQTPATSPEKWYSPFAQSADAISKTGPDTLVKSRALAEYVEGKINSIASNGNTPFASFGVAGISYQATQGQTDEGILTNAFVSPATLKNRLIDLQAEILEQTKADQSLQDVTDKDATTDKVVTVAGITTTGAVAIPTGSTYDIIVRNRQTGEYQTADVTTLNFDRSIPVAPIFQPQSFTVGQAAEFYFPPFTDSVTKLPLPATAYTVNFVPDGMAVSIVTDGRIGLNIYNTASAGVTSVKISATLNGVTKSIDIPITGVPANVTPPTTPLLIDFGTLTLTDIENSQNKTLNIPVLYGTGDPVYFSAVGLFDNQTGFANNIAKAVINADIFVNGTTYIIKARQGTREITTDFVIRPVNAPTVSVVSALAIKRTESNGQLQIAVSATKNISVSINGGTYYSVGAYASTPGYNYGQIFGFLVSGGRIGMNTISVVETGTTTVIYSAGFYWPDTDNGLVFLLNGGSIEAPVISTDTARPPSGTVYIQFPSNNTAVLNIAPTYNSSDNTWSGTEQATGTIPAGYEQFYILENELDENWRQTWDETARYSCDIVTRITKIITRQGVPPTQRMLTENLYGSDPENRIAMQDIIVYGSNPNQ